MRRLNLDDLKLGQPGVSPKAGAFMVEAAVETVFIVVTEFGKPTTKIEKNE